MIRIPDPNLPRQESTEVTLEVRVGRVRYRHNGNEWDIAWVSNGNVEILLRDGGRITYPIQHVREFLADGTWAYVADAPQEAPRGAVNGPFGVAESIIGMPCERGVPEICSCGKHAPQPAPVPVVGPPRLACEWPEHDADQCPDDYGPIERRVMPFPGGIAAGMVCLACYLAEEWAVSNVKAPTPDRSWLGSWRVPERGCGGLQWRRR
jgi:hypothetical protein